MNSIAMKAQFPRILGVAALASILPVAAQDTATFQPSSVQVYFSPNGGAGEACVREINAAKKSIFVQAYSFTSAPIASALVAARRRGVAVSAILDSSQRTERYSSADFLAHGGVVTLIDGKHAIAHSKVMVIDEAVVITGSYNFTKAAEERNSENLLVIRDVKTAAQFLKNWKDHRTHAETYTGR